MSQEKISRKKLQEPDEFLSTSQRVWTWVHANQRVAVMAAGGVAVALLAVVVVKSLIESSHAKRASAVAEAVGKYAKAAEGKIPAEVKKEMTDLAERYQGSSEGSLAKYLQAGALAANGEGDQARRVYADLAADGAKHGDLATLSRVALAYLDLAGGATDAALKSFQELLKAEGAAVPRARIMMDVAAIHEKQGRPAEARRVYEELLAAHPDGSWAATAKDRLKLLPGGAAAS